MPSSLQEYTPDVSIAIDGRRQNDLEMAVTDITIDEVLSSHSMFTLSLFDELDERTLRLKWLDSSLLDPAAGREISISVDYVEGPGGGGPLMAGYITALSPTFTSSGMPSLTVEGYDHSYRLQKTGSEKTFAKMADYSEIVKKIALMNSIGVGKIDKTGVKPRDIVTIDAEESDYVFLRRLAERFGYDFYVRNKKLFFINPTRSRESAVVLTWGKDLMSFSPRMSAAGVLSGVTVTGHSPAKTYDPVMGVATVNDLGFIEQGAKSGAALVRSGLGEAKIFKHSVTVGSAEEAKAVARAVMIRANDSFVEGGCECIGNPAIRAGSRVSIQGVGRRFSGVYMVARARHSLGTDGYTTSLDLKRGGAGVA